jgi:hypothetical protein
VPGIPILQSSGLYRNGPAGALLINPATIGAGFFAIIRLMIKCPPLNY